MKKKYIVLILCLILVPTVIMSVSLIKLQKRDVITLTLWHNYGGQMKNTMDEMLEEFNATVGAKEGVYINVTSISGTESLQEKLTMAAAKDPGAPQLPDITTAYPKTAVTLADNNLLVNLNEYFTKEELSGYIPRFIEEGRLNGEELYVFPTAKSTEVLFLNSTIFNRFAAETGASLEDLSTFEGIAKTSELYYKWTDSLTPEVAGDGKTFYVPDSIFNLSLIGCRQLGSDFITGGTIDFSGSDTKKVWNTFMQQAVKGQFAIFDGYASDLAKTGDIVCSTGSTAGVLFFSPNVTYPDNTSEEAKLSILPYPTFEGGKKVAIQRGAGMCIIKSNKEKERLASLFLKWFTSPENNLRFVASTGYLPVTTNAFGDILLKENAAAKDPRIEELLQVTKKMQLEYDFCISPLFDGVDELQDSYESNMKAMALQARNAYFEFQKTDSPKTAFNKVMDGKYEEFAQEFQSMR